VAAVGGHPGRWGFAVFGYAVPELLGCNCGHAGELQGGVGVYVVVPVAAESANSVGCVVRLSRLL